MTDEKFEKCSTKAIEILIKKYGPLMDEFLQNIKDIDELTILMNMLAQRMVANAILLNQNDGVIPEKTIVSIVDGSFAYVQDGAAYIETQVAINNIKKSYWNQKNG